MPPKKIIRKEKEQFEDDESKDQDDDISPNKKIQKQVQKKLKIVNQSGVEIKPSVNNIKLELGAGVFDKECLSIASWNVNGIRAILKRNDLTDYFKTGIHDIICLNETKIDESSFLSDGIGHKFPKEYFQYFNFCKPPKSGYSGVAILSKVKPISVVFDLNVEKHDQEGRTLTLEFDKFFIVSCYVPNAGQKLDRLSYRTKEWDIDFKEYLNQLKSKKPTLVCGDLNVAHNDIDISNPKGNQKSAGFTPEERKGFTDLLQEGWVDSFRKLHPTEQKYSFFSARSNAKATNKGWRLDYFIIDREHENAITHSDINNTINGSDHTPVEIKLELTRL